jgi:starch synthase
MFDGIEEEHIKELKEPDYINMMKLAIKNSDAIITGSEELPEELSDYLKELEMPMLKYHKKEEFSSAYLDFYLTEVLS